MKRVREIKIINVARFMGLTSVVKAKRKVLMKLHRKLSLECVRGRILFLFYFKQIHEALT